jgi:hypothetical protein
VRPRYELIIAFIEKAKELDTYLWTSPFSSIEVKEVSGIVNIRCVTHSTIDIT